MAHISDQIQSLRKLQKSISNTGLEGSLLLVDLIESTAYKTRNGEAAWLTRLYDFYEGVQRALAPLVPVKYLGDGILGFYAPEVAHASSFVDKAFHILREIGRINLERQYTGEHQIRVRIVLGYGRVFLYEQNDPQGTIVDKLFRMEKYVPEGCIGLLEDFVSVAKLSNVTLIGRFSLKGLAEGRHPLYMHSDTIGQAANSSVERIRRLAALGDIWDLGSANKGKMIVVSGYIPPDPGEHAVTQVGNRDAVIQAFRNIAKVGRVNDIEMLISRDVGENHLRENIISIGGPYWNKVTLRFMREVKCPFIFDFSAPDDRTPMIDCLTGSRYEALWSGKRLRRDWGFFARFQNPFNKERDVILACGIETFGVAGVVQVFSEDQNEFLHLHESILSSCGAPGTPGRLRDFIAVMPFEADDISHVHLPASNDQVARIVRDWGSNGANYPLQEYPSD